MILKVARRARYTVMDRATIRDKRLSYRALGLLLALLDAPEGASVNSEQLSQLRPEGRDAIRSALKELETCGYLVRSRERDAAGRMVTVSIVSERPVESAQLDLGTGDGIPVVGPPVVGAPGVGSPGALGKNLVPNGTMKDHAASIVGEVYRSRNPKPATPFRTAVGIVDKLLGAGWDPEQVKATLAKVPTVSLGHLESELKRGGATVRQLPQRVDQDRTEESGRVAL